ncbi:anaerobic ribonucleoside-triphosphate reductase [Bacillus cereus]
MISGITNHNYYTNSFHIPVYYNIQAINKIRLEGPFHALCNGGHITYIELDGAAMHNKKGIKTNCASDGRTWRWIRFN